MLNLCTNQNVPSLYQFPIIRSGGVSAPLIQLRTTLLAATTCADAAPVALKCAMPMDALELDKQGYPYSYFERHKQIARETLSSLRSLGIRKIAFFSDADGADFDVENAIQSARLFNITLYRVVLPFRPSNLVYWDAWQWRIFDSRLTSALGFPLRKSSKGSISQGGPCNAKLH